VKAARLATVHHVSAARGLGGNAEPPPVIASAAASRLDAQGQDASQQRHPACPWCREPAVGTSRICLRHRRSLLASVDEALSERVRAQIFGRPSCESP
jgi:hypothetical protein